MCSSLLGDCGFVHLFCDIKCFDSVVFEEVGISCSNHCFALFKKGACIVRKNSDEYCILHYIMKSKRLRASCLLVGYCLKMQMYLLKSILVMLRCHIVTSTFNLHSKKRQT